MLSDLQCSGPPTGHGLARHLPSRQPRGKIMAADSHSSTLLRPEQGLLHPVSTATTVMKLRLRDYVSFPR